MELDALNFGERADGVDGGADDGGQINPLHVEANLAGDDAREIEQVFDDLRLAAGVALDDLEGFGDFAWRDVA